MKLKTESWLNFAKADLKSSKKLLEDNDLAQMVAFHCQQTIEIWGFYLKGLQT